MAKSEHPASPFRAGGRTGLTLIEVMLAMAILGIGIVVLLDAAARCLAVIRTSRNYHTARAVLDQGELDFPIIKEDDQFINVAVEPVEYPNGFTFARMFEETDEEGLYVLRTQVAWSDRGRHPYEEVLTYFYCTNEFR